MSLALRAESLSSQTRLKINFYFANASAVQVSISNISRLNGLSLQPAARRPRFDNLLRVSVAEPPASITHSNATNQEQSKAEQIVHGTIIKFLNFKYKSVNKRGFVLLSYSYKILF